MRGFSRFLILALMFVLSFATVAYGSNTTELEELIKQLQSDNSMLNGLVDMLNDQLIEAQKDPTAPAPRKPIIIITSPLVVDIEAGKSKTVEFTLENLTSYTAREVVSKFSFEGAGLSGGFKDRSNNISSIGSKAKKTISFEITAHESATEGFHKLTFSHSFLNEYNEEATITSSIDINVKSAASGGVSLKDISAASNIAPGNNFDLSAVIHNESNKVMKDVSVTIEGMSSDKIYLRSSTNVVDIASLVAGKKENISIGLTTNSKIPKGSYELTLTLEYDDGSATRQRKPYKYFVVIADTKTDENAAEVIITNITYPTATMGVGQEFTMGVTVKNISEYVAKNITISAQPADEAAIVPNSNSKPQIAQLAAGEEKQITFRFIATNSAKSRNYVIGFGVDYKTGLEDDNGKDEIKTLPPQYQGVNISNPEEDKKEDNEKKTSTPKIIVSSYKSNPIIVKAGQEFDLDMTFLNTSSEKEVKNIKVILSVEEEITSGSERKGSVFTPVNSSNTFYIDRIGPKGEFDEHIRLYTLPDASPKNYIIKVRFEYEDMDNNEYSAEENVGINVKQITRLDTSEIGIEQWGALYQPIYVNFEFYNTGKVTLSNLMIKVEGNFEANQSSVYYGSFGPSSTDYYDNQIMPTETGLQEGAIVITYEDDTGEVIEERKPFSVEVSEPMGMGDDMGMRPEMIWDEKTGEMVPAAWNEKGELVPAVWDDAMGMFVPAKQGLSNIVKIGIAVGAVVIVGAAAVVGMRIKKKKQESTDIDE